MEFTLSILAAGAILSAQLLLGLVAKIQLHRLPGKFVYQLSSKITVADVVQKFMRIVSSIDVKPSGITHAPAQAEIGILLLNRKLAHHFDMYSTVFTLQQALITLRGTAPWKWAYYLQLATFLVQVTLLILGVTLSWLFLVPSITLGVLLLLSCFYLQSELQDLHAEVQDLAIDFLDLDKVERIRSANMLAGLDAVVFIYPTAPFIFLWRLLFPYWLIEQMSRFARNVRK